MQGMEPTQENTGNIGGGDQCRELDPQRECRECRHMVVGTVSLVRKGHHIGNGVNTGNIGVETYAKNWTHAENAGNIGI